MYSGPLRWDGLYGGVHVGGAWLDGDATDVSGYNILGENIDLDDGSFAGGLQVGLQRQSDRLVYGIEADFTLTGIDGDGASAFLAGTDTFLSTDVDWIATLRGRLGYDLDGIMLFVTGGLALADIEHEVNDIIIAGGPDSISLDSSNVEAGWVIGFGGEWAFDDRTSIKAEYLYMDFGKDSLSGTSTLGGTVNYRFDTEVQQARVGIQYRF